VTTTLLDRVPVDEISTRAREARPGRVALTVIAGVLFGVGWVAAKTLGVVWLGVAWCFTAARLGWRDARGNQPSRASLREENERLRQQLARYGG
jgi:uncharacterized membrane protein YdjX (TVP38/TMEM64 family)